MRKNYTVIFNGDIFWENYDFYAIIGTLINSKCRLIDNKINHIFHGSVIMTNLSKKIISVKKDNKDYFSKYETKIDIFKYKNIGAHLWNSANSGFCSWNNEFKSADFIMKRLFAITITGISKKTILKVDKKLKATESYYGFFESKVYDQLENEIYYGNMINDMCIIKKELMYNKNSPDEDYAYDFENVDFKVKMLWDSDYRNQIKPYDFSSYISSECSFFYKKQQHNELVMERLLQYIDENPNSGISFFLKEGFSVENIKDMTDKLIGYCLNMEHVNKNNPGHSDGKDKAIMFKNELNITCDDVEFLKSQIINGVLNSNDFIEIREVNNDGIKYALNIPIKGKNNKIKNITAAFFMNSKTNEIHLTTAYVNKKKRDKISELQIFYLEKDEHNYLQKLLSIAQKYANEMEKNMFTTPMFITNMRDPIMDGECGYADILLYDYIIVKELRKLGYDVVYRKKGEWIFYIDKFKENKRTQSYEKNKVFAESFSYILKLNNISCSVRAWYD